MNDGVLARARHPSCTNGIGPLDLPIGKQFRLACRLKPRDDALRLPPPPAHWKVEALALSLTFDICFCILVISLIVLFFFPQR
jgi:hypothetical protein